MITVTLWLLMSVGNGRAAAGAQPSMTLAQFQTAADCEDVRSQLLAAWSTEYPPRLQCVKAKIAVLK